MTKKRNPVNQKIKLLFFLTPLVMILTMVLVHFIFNVSLFSNNDSTNWATSVIEMGIGTSITIAILIYSNNQLKKSEEQQEKITGLVLSIQNIEQRHERREKKRLNIFSCRIMTNLETMLYSHHELRQKLTGYLEKSTEENKRNIVLSIRENLDVKEHFAVLQIKSDIEYIGELFEDPLLGQNIITQCNDYEKTLKNIDDVDWKKDTIMLKIATIDSQVEELTSILDRIKKEIMTKPE
jgi:hypothetical protein